MRKPADEQRLIALGTITTVHGIRGQVKVRSFTAIPEDIISYGPLQTKAGKELRIKLNGGTNDSLIAAVEGVTTREVAESLRNTELFVPRSALPAPQKNHYYLEDLVGLTLLTDAGAVYGSISAMHNFGAGDLVAVKRESGEEEMLPFTKKTFQDIDFDKGTAVIVPPETIADE